MPKALTIIPAAPYRYLPRLARGATLAAALFLALGAGEAAAAARPSAERAPAASPAEAPVLLAGGEHRGQRLHLQRGVPRVHHYRGGRHGAHRHGPQKRREFHRHGQGHPKLQHRGRRLYGQACRPVKVVGWHRGHRALFGQVLCVNRFGQRSFLRGSRYLIRYLHH